MKEWRRKGQFMEGTIKTRHHGKIKRRNRRERMLR